MSHEQLASLGWDDDRNTDFAPYAADHRAGRVARVDRGAADVLTANGHLRLAVAGSASLAVGDWIALAPDGTLTTVLPRRTSIARAVANGRSDPQVLAANVDHVLVAAAAVPLPKPGFVERLVALAWESGATPVVVLTKADLTGEAEAISAELAECAPGVDVVAVSALADGGLDGLLPYLAPGRTVCLVGRSGAGKSTLVNALLGTELLATSDIRADGKGRHTTTHRQLVPLPTGAVLIDTPGLRGAGLWVGDEGLDRAFADVEELIPDCRFNDCQHQTEPGCAVLAAIDEGRLAARRLDSWRKLQREAEWMASRHDARLRAERRREWRILYQGLRRSGAVRP